ncbi:MAG: HepT-like ribonuclease domain-containing protein [Hydrogenobaculum sp.]
MRDKLIYDYFWVDLEIVWQTVIEDIPKLIVEIQDIIKS